MDFIKKLYSDESFVFFVDIVKEKPFSSVLTPATLIIFCYYIYNYIRRFYPIYVNCWFCNSNFSVPYKERSEYTCPHCGQFNGFKEDGSYSKPIPEQHDVSRNTRNFVLSQDDVKGSKNGLCHKCNIIQEIKIKQLASFTPTNEKYFDREIEAFKNNLEKSLKLCHKCEVYTKKILHFQEIRYNLKAASKNSETQNENSPNWPLICSVCLSFIITLLLLHIGNYVGVWAMKYFEVPTIYIDFITVDRLVNAMSVFGTLILIYQSITTMSLLSAAIMLCWSTLVVVNGFQLLDRFKARLLLSTLNILLSVYAMIIKSMNKSNNHSSRLQSYNDNRLSATPSFDMSRQYVLPKAHLRENRFRPGSSNEFVVRLPKFKVARILNEKIFLKAIPKPVQYTTRDEYDNIVDVRRLTSQNYVLMDRLKTVTTPR
ncbi:uncharacterized protein LOC126841060 isoform X2 [Adelges cooleyi]|uniref:uncharacterized protein LOC126841060 isoform X2 n=1 Tax=Adelges cooleyi TaxID=133065 RepID=UPI0021804433|nr:uncharacterized protein LOC126841060 isoform X2 [Adelges cooleyi]